MFKKNLSPFVFFPLLTMVVFWPLSLRLFTLKNDALTYYYPVRTLICDALRNHELPLWTPYINMGYPLHADMQSSAWNPIVWLFSFLTNYNLAAFQYELLFYLCFAGIGCYYLCREFGWSKSTAFIIAVAYELSGFMIDSAQFFVCISSACYLPYVFIFFRKFIIRLQAADSILTAFFLYLFFTGGYPSLFITTIYFLLAYTIFIFWNTGKKIHYLKKSLLPTALLIATFILLCLPAIISFTRHLPYIVRGKAQSLQFVLENSMPPFSMISLISPFSTTANFALLNTDMLMRNTYIGIVPILFLFYGISNKLIWKNKEVKFFFITGLIMFGLAFGRHFFLRPLTYYILPLMNTFRHPALFRLFGIFCFLYVAGFSINEYQKNNLAKNRKFLTRVWMAFLSVIIITGIIIAISGGHKIIGNIHPGSSGLNALKSSLSQLNFYQRFFIQLPVILLILLAFKTIMHRQGFFKWLMLLSVIDFFAASQLNMPITIIGAKRFNEVENIFKRNKERFPAPGKNSIEINSYNTYDSTNGIGSKIPFEKRIGRNDYFITPGNLMAQIKFYGSPVREKVFANPVIYFADTLTYNPLTTANGDSIIITGFSANTLECNTNNKIPSSVIYLQNDYPGWKAFIDNNPAAIKKVDTTFMAVNIPAGRHTLIFRYNPRLVIYSWYLSMMVLISVLIFFLVRLFRSSSLFAGQQ